jgi:hypothetical protein
VNWARNAEDAKKYVRNVRTFWGQSRFCWAEDFGSNDSPAKQILLKESSAWNQKRDADLK